MGVIKSSSTKSIKEINSMIIDLEKIYEEKKLSKKKIISLFKILIPNFNHIETNKNLDEKM